MALDTNAIAREGINDSSIMVAMAGFYISDTPPSPPPPPAPPTFGGGSGGGGTGAFWIDWSDIGPSAEARRRDMLLKQLQREDLEFEQFLKDALPRILQ